MKLDQTGFNFQGITRSKKALSTGDPGTVLMDHDWLSIEIRQQASSRLYGDAGQRRILFGGIGSIRR